MSDMEFTKYWTSERARKKQTALTKLSNGLRKEVLDNPLANELFDREEIEAIEVAVKALSQVKRKFAHIKEKKARNEKRMAEELASIKATCKKHAAQILDSLNPNHETFTKEQFCLWVTASNYTRMRLVPESWELDINHNIDNHYLDSDHTLRQRHVWSMRDKALEALEECLDQAWTFSVKEDAWVARVPIKEAVETIQALTKSSEYSNVEKRYAHLIEPLEAFNREVEAVQRRKNIKSV
ncbi:hypothetical protein L1D14_04045 [Vibrio tubiashii]|uniref:hypothetical protein n=1 Tax=Vibrio tubiashii TaxID=29498 RepID=UPI001EFD86D7|nr:hypothetical protein [Vibrio tubiashii]MCG9575402.1 hypothetical protein [Vibrio tubiashii]